MDEQDTLPARTVGPWHIAGIIAIVVGFAVTMESVSVTWAGDEVHAHYRNWGALVGGAVAILAALIAIATQRKPVASLAISVALLAAGGYHVARGLGVFYDPGAPRGPSVAAGDTIGDVHKPTARDAGAPADAGPTPAELADKQAQALRAACHGDLGDPCKQWRAAAEHACELGGLASCSELGSALLDEQVGGPPDPPRSRALLKQACDAGDNAACVNLGYAEHKGLGGPVDAALARKHAMVACIDDDRDGCRNLAIYARKDPDVTPDDKLGAFTEACFHGALFQACGDAADLALARKDRTADDDHQLRGLLAHACRLDGDPACRYYADMLRKGVGGPAHPELATLIDLRACHLGLAKACTGGARPRKGPVVLINGVNTTEPEQYETAPLLDDIQERLVPCARMAPKLVAEPQYRIHVALDGTVRAEPKGGFDDVPAEVARCFEERFPTHGLPIVTDDRTVTGFSFNLVLAFGTQS
jgi:TPR repeat protein